MPTRDPNDTTFFVLRYPPDFGDGTSAPDAPFAAESGPYLSPELVHDPDRHVTELRPAPTDVVARPPSGIAVAPGGEVYRVDRGGRLVHRRCDGSETPVPCEADLLRRPLGLALDRRGWLYVADPGARRVLVLDPVAGAAVNVLSAGSTFDPVDVAVAPSGAIYVADRAGGRIVRFTSSFRPSGSFVPRDATGLPAVPRPIAVMVDGEGRVVVADQTHPRLLRFGPDGTPTASAELSWVAGGLTAADVALDVLGALYGPRRPVFLAVPCGLPCPPPDGPARLAAVHFALRVARLCLGRTFETTGTWVCRRLDSGVPGTTWHKVVLDAELPPGTTVTVETGTSDRGTTPPKAWDAPRDTFGHPIPFSTDVPDQLVQSPPGRFLWLRMTFGSTGSATPSIRAIRAHHPRNSPIALLPAFWQRDPETRRFTERFLALIERVDTGIEATYEQFLRDLDPSAAPMELTDWLGALLDLAFDPSWPLDRRRALLGSAVELYRIRGTPEGIRRYVEIYTGREPVVLESFLGRPGRATYLGVPGTILGCTTSLCGCAPDRTPDAALYDRYAHRFTVVAPLADPLGCDAEVAAAVVGRIVEVNKPAHTAHTVEIARADARVGLQSRVGIDLVLGAPTAPLARIVDPNDPNAPVDGGVLGVDSVIGDRGSGFLGGDGRDAWTVGGRT